MTGRPVMKPIHRLCRITVLDECALRHTPFPGVDVGGKAR